MLCQGGADQLGRPGETLRAMPATISCAGEDGADQLFGGNGWDVLYGGAGDDELYGEGDTDTLKGEAGNDTLNGGSGIAYLYGGDGNDQLNYNPTTSDIFALGNYLAPTILDGDAGTDTLNISNKATAQSFEGTGLAAGTEIVMTGPASGRLYFEDDFGSYIEVGKFQEVEKLTATGKGGLEFYGYDVQGTGTNVTGTARTIYSSATAPTTRCAAGLAMTASSRSAAMTPSSATPTTPISLLSRRIIFTSRGKPT